MKTLIFAAIWSMCFASPKAFPSVKNEACAEVREVKDDPFRVDCDRVRVYLNGSWQDVIYASHTFVFNSNDHNDVTHYYPNDKVEKYRRITEVKKNTNKDGKPYQQMTVLSSDGDEIILLLFEMGVVRLFYTNDFWIDFWAE